VTITIEEFRKLLADPQLVRSRLHRGEGTQAMPVDSLVALAQSRTQAEITVAEVDQLIKSLGAQRVNVTSLDHPFRRANRRVRGKTNPPPEALYVLPDEALLQGAAVSRCASVDRPFRASREAEPVCLLHGRATL
jgi:hypothetical protein